MSKKKKMFLRFALNLLFKFEVVNPSFILSYKSTLGILMVSLEAIHNDLNIPRMNVQEKKNIILISFLPKIKKSTHTLWISCLHKT